MPSARLDPWEQHRLEITRLYVDEELTLHEVADMMKARGFIRRLVLSSRIGGKEGSQS